MLGGIFILIVATLGVFIYLRSSGDDTETTDPATDPSGQTYSTPQEYATPEATPPANAAVKLSDELVLSPTLFYLGDGVSYFDRQGQLYKGALQKGSTGYTLSSLRQLTLPARSNISKAIWPVTGNNFIVESQSATGGRAWSVFNGLTNTYVDLPSNVTSIDWFPDGETLAYIWMDSAGKSTLNLAISDNSQYQEVAEIWESDDEIKVSPDGQSILYYRRGNDGATNAINLTTPDGSLFRSIVKDGYNLGVLWAPDSRFFLFGRRSSNGQYELWLGDITAGAVRSLNVFAPVEKAIWGKDSKTVYIASPKSDSSSLGLSEDTIVRIDTDTLEKKEFDPGAGIDARDLFLSLTDDALFFKNAQDEALYYIDLTQ